MKLPRERNDLKSSPNPGPPVMMSTTMCGMCRTIVATNASSATRKLPNGRIMYVCADHAPRRPAAQVTT